MLTPDLSRFDEKDFTIIGERGVTLSGGQKQRVSLARAAYSVLSGNSDIVILDDVLSALDAETGKKVFDTLIGPKGLMNQTTRILVTHALQYTAQADLIMLISSGKCSFVGKPSEIQNAITKEVVDHAPDGGYSTLLQGLVDHTQEEAELSSTYDAPISTSSAMLSAGEGSLNREAPIVSKELMTTESSETDVLSLEVVKQYLKAAGGGNWSFVIILVTLLILERVFYAFTDYWLAIWTSAVMGQVHYSFLPVGQSSSLFYVEVYIGASILACVLAYWRTRHTAMGGARAAKNLFGGLLDALLRSPVTFFETTPLGRIVNRVSYDVQAMDYTLVARLNATVASTFWILSSVVVIISVTPLVTCVLLPVCVIYYFLQLYYRRACIQIQRIDSTTRSPIQSCIVEAITGTSSIRSYGATARFITKEDRNVDVNNKALMMYAATNRWLGIRLELLGSLVTVAVALLCWREREIISGGLAGFALLWGINFTISLNFQVMFSTECEAKMNCVERIMEYSKLAPEAPLYKSDVVLSKCWPQKGSVSFSNVVLRYRKGLPPALNNLTFSIAGGSRIGVVGRTGSGKSTLAVALFRIVEIEAGDITVDGVSLSGLGLSDVRGKSLTIIPQDPVLFSGTVRNNLDPFGEHTDVELFDALAKVELGISVIPSLDVMVDTGGKNWSVGQRQVINNNQYGFMFLCAYANTFLLLAIMSRSRSSKKA